MSSHWTLPDTLVRSSLTDAVVNVYPTILEKRDIIQNSIELLHVLGQPLPKVAILAAFDRVEPNVRSTMEAAALCKMAERGQITGAILDGPLALDSAISQTSAEENAIESPVAGSADILLVPDLEVGQMLVQQLESLSSVRAAGLVLGARVPIVLSGPGDTEGTLACILGFGDFGCARKEAARYGHKTGARRAQPVAVNISSRAACPEIRTLPRNVRRYPPTIPPRLENSHEHPQFKLPFSSDFCCRRRRIQATA